MAAQTVTTISSAYAKIALGTEQMDASAKWKWAKELDAFLSGLAGDKERTVSSVEIGKNIATAIGRDKPYSGSWVRQHAAAYRQFPEGLQTREDYRNFLRACNGNAGQSKQPPVSTTDSESESEGGDSASTPDPMAKLRKLIKSLLKQGFESVDIRNAVEEALR